MDLLGKKAIIGAMIKKETTAERHHLGVRISRPTKMILEDIAISRGVSLSVIVRAALDAYAKSHARKKAAA
jgi:hypothetical protein